MTPGTRNLLTLAGIALGAAGAAWLLGLFGPAPLRSNPANPWITLKRRTRKGRRQRVFIDDEGRIERGLPEHFRGVHIGDLTELSRETRAIRKTARRAAQRMARRTPSTFRNKEAAYEALLAANPELLDFLEREGGNASPAYRAWLRRGRRGPKPQLASYDGRLDAINQFWDLHGARAAGSWLEAVRATIPSSHRWDDFAERLPVLEEATGLRLALPAAAERRELGRRERAAFDEDTERAVEDLTSQARRGRLGAAGVPF